MNFLNDLPLLNWPQEGKVLGVIEMHRSAIPFSPNSSPESSFYISPFFIQSVQQHTGHELLRVFLWSYNCIQKWESWMLKTTFLTWDAQKPANSKQIFQKAFTFNEYFYTVVGVARRVVMGGSYAGVGLNVPRCTGTNRIFQLSKPLGHCTNTV